MKKTSLICAMLAMLMLFYACASTDTNPAVNTGKENTAAPESEQEETTYLSDSLPDGLDFNGAAFNMLSPNEYDG